MALLRRSKPGGGTVQPAADPELARELLSQTDEGAQEMRRSEPATSRAVQELIVTGELWPDPEPGDETTILNMGPQHPSTHGVLRIMLELEGETVLRLTPVI